jgi:hypothetical protein
MSEPRIDAPKVPRTPVSWVVKIYAAVAGVVLVLYLVAGVVGWDVKSSERDRVPGSVRNSPGGYRAYHFWHSGYSGGK